MPAKLILNEIERITCACVRALAKKKMLVRRRRRRLWRRRRPSLLSPPCARGREARSIWLYPVRTAERAHLLSFSRFFSYRMCKTPKQLHKCNSTPCRPKLSISPQKVKLHFTFCTSDNMVYALPREFQWSRYILRKGCATDAR